MTHTSLAWFCFISLLNPYKGFSSPLFLICATYPYFSFPLPVLISAIYDARKRNKFASACSKLKDGLYFIFKLCIVFYDILFALAYQ